MLVRRIQLTVMLCAIFSRLNCLFSKVWNLRLSRLTDSLVAWLKFANEKGLHRIGKDGHNDFLISFRTLVKPFPRVWWAISLANNLSETYKGRTCGFVVLPKTLMYVNHCSTKYLPTTRRYVVAYLENLGALLLKNN